MVASPHTSLERLAAKVFVALGFAIAVALAPKTSYFLPNFAYFWGSQLAVLALLLPINPRPAIVAGVALSLAAYLAVFHTLLFAHDPPQSLAWLGYIFSLPGAALGAIAIALWLRGRPTWQPLAAGSIAAVVVIVGVVANQAILCSANLYCIGRWPF